MTGKPTRKPTRNLHMSQCSPMPPNGACNGAGDNSSECGEFSGIIRVPYSHEYYVD